MMMDTPPAISAPAPTGAGSTMVRANGVPIRVFTYRPAHCRITGLLVVFHGLNRNADSYRDDARPLADKLCFTVAAPLFDEARFSTWAYQRGGIADHGDVLPPARWTVSLVAPLVAALRQAEGLEGAPYYMIGHSAGAQFLGRVAAYAPGEAARIVIANPSTYVLPSIGEDAPYGFGRLPGGDAMLRRYLAAPVTLLLGEEDTGEKNLAEGAAAMRQGGTRIERGRRTFAMAQTYAQKHGLAFGWRLIEVPGVGHNARSIFASDQAIAALGVDAGAQAR